MKHFAPRFIVLVLLPLCLAMGVLAGCQSTVNRPAAGEKIVLEFWTLQMLNFSDYINAMIDEYEKAHPNVTIKWVDVPFSEGEKKALTRMLAKQTPDVINLNPDFSAILASRGALLDMNKWVPEAQRESYLPVAWQGTTLNNLTFGIPWYLSSAVTLYNQDLLTQAGVKTPPATYAEMAPLAKAIQQKTKGHLLMPTIAEGGRFFRVLRKDGIPLWDDGMNRLVFADNGAGKELAFWVDLYKSGAIPRESITEGQQAAVDRYQSGTLGLLLTGPNFLNIVKENAPKVFEATGVAPQFPQKSDFMDFSEMILVVPQRAAHPKEAVDFALFVTNAENTLKLSELAPVLPPHTDVLNSPAFQAGPTGDKLVQARAISARQLLAAKVAMPVHPIQNQLNQIMNFYVQAAFLGKYTPEAAMKKAQDEMNKLLQ